MFNFIAFRKAQKREFDLYAKPLKTAKTRKNTYNAILSSS